MLVVEAACEGDERAARLGLVCTLSDNRGGGCGLSERRDGLRLGLRRGLNLDDGLLDRGGSCSCWRTVGASLCLCELLTELLVLPYEAAHFCNDLIEEVVDLILVVPLAELGLLEAFVDDVLRSECHVGHLSTLSAIGLYLV